VWPLLQQNFQFCSGGGRLAWVGADTSAQVPDVHRGLCSGLHRNRDFGPGRRATAIWADHTTEFGRRRVTWASDCYAMERTNPPSARKAAPFVAADSGLATYATK
jgi:hypothetical protein